jgi:hypothetical protein
MSTCTALDGAGGGVVTGVELSTTEASNACADVGVEASAVEASAIMESGGVESGGALDNGEGDGEELSACAALMMFAAYVSLLVHYRQLSTEQCFYLLRYAVCDCLQVCSGQEREDARIHHSEILRPIHE